MASPAEASTAEPSRRTDWAESRRRILAAARELFAQRGYRGTTTRALADHAGISVMTLRRHFPSKAELFQAAVLTPLGESIEHFLRGRDERGPATRDSARETLRFFDGLVEAIVGEDKLLVAASLSFTDDEDLVSDQTRSYVDEFFAGLEALFAEKIAEYGLDIDPHLAPRVIVGSALGVVVNRNWLFPAGRRPDQADLAAELAKITTWGVAGKPGGAALGQPPKV